MVMILADAKMIQNYVFEISKDPDLFHLYECKDCVEDGTKFFATKLHAGMILWLTFQLFMVLVFLYFIADEVIKVLRNFKDMRTFYEENILSFRKMGRYGLFIAATLAIRIMLYNNPETGYELSNVRVKIPFAEIAFALACFVLADVFEQGRKLKEENESIL